MTWMSMEEGAFSLLEAELQARRRDIDRIGDRIEERRAAGGRGAEAVDSMGYQLHNLYGAFEQLFEEVARFFENRVDDGRHRADLLRRMQLDIRGVRPALLSEATARGLDELRRFRHLFRHAYGTDPDAVKVGDLAAGVAGIRDAFARDSERFLAALRPRQ